MAIRKNKKGLFLTFISIAIIAAMISIFAPTDINLKKDISVVKTRVNNIDNYVFDLEKVYLENTLNAIGRRTIIALIDYMGTEGIFLTNFHDDFSQVLLDGTIVHPTDGSQPIDNYIDPDIMTGNTFNDKLNEIKTAANNAFNVDTVFNPINPTDIRVQQSNPWFVNVEMDISLTVTTAEGTAAWSKPVTVITDINVKNFRDPYYLVKTGGSYENSIIETKTKFDEWTVEKVKDHIRDGTYVHFQSSNAPNFLSRFVDDVTASSCCGIESLVDDDKLPIVQKNKKISYVDYLYWDPDYDCDASYTLFKVSSVHPNFKIDLDHLAKYELTADVQLCPPTP
jgi:hypothetical protein